MLQNNAAKIGLFCSERAKQAELSLAGYLWPYLTLSAPQLLKTIKCQFSQINQLLIQFDCWCERVMVICLRSMFCFMVSVLWSWHLSIIKSRYLGISITISRNVNTRIIILSSSQVDSLTRKLIVLPSY